MKCTSIGHAFWLIETECGTLMFDPVLFDPFEQGTVTACPSRKIDIENLPHFDVLYLSHRHMDHFDLPTLMHLDKSKPVLIPDEELSIASLKKLGFVNIWFTIWCFPSSKRETTFWVDNAIVWY